MKLMLIEWEDSHSGRGWHDLDDIKKTAEPLRCRSVGWLAASNDECRLLVPHLGGETQDNSQGCGDMVIPVRAIIKETELAQP